MKYDVLIYGPLFCDLIFTGLPAMPVLGTELFAEDLTIAIGGSAIVAAGLHRLGARVGLIADARDLGEREYDAFRARVSGDAYHDPACVRPASEIEPLGDLKPATSEDYDARARGDE